jgi:pimeloyl-ACP methyl ester carboxylesterase
MATVETRRIRLWQDKVETQVEISGGGAPLVFLHGPWGLRDHDCLDRLAADHLVYAPRHPGTTFGDPDAIHQLDDWLDLVVYCGELLDRLGLDAVSLVGHSFGGMLACEIAAAMPVRVRKLVLIDPIGLWRDNLPVRNWMLLPEDQRRGALFADPTGPAAEQFFELPGDPAVRVEAQADFVWSQACTGKFVWPIPDKGLKKRVHRIAAPTLIVWGQADTVIAPAYAHEFARRITGARLALIANAGHLPHLERPDEVVPLVRKFLLPP